MNFSKDYFKTTHVYEVKNTEFYVEICKNNDIYRDDTIYENSEESKNIEVWLCCDKYGVKDLMFSIKYTDDYLETIKSNVEDYINDFITKYDKEEEDGWAKLNIILVNKNADFKCNG